MRLSFSLHSIAAIVVFSMLVISGHAEETLYTHPGGFSGQIRDGRDHKCWTYKGKDADIKMEFCINGDGRQVWEYDPSTKQIKIRTSNHGILCARFKWFGGTTLWPLVAERCDSSVGQQRFGQDSQKLMGVLEFGRGVVADQRCIVTNGAAPKVSLNKCNTWGAPGKWAWIYEHETPSPTPPPTPSPTPLPTLNPTPFPTNTPTRGPTKAPTKAPTRAPTKTPTKAPTKAPTNSPSSAPTGAPVPVPVPVPEAPAPGAPGPTPKGSASGDPHFKTWSGHKFDFHGECDLVLLDNPGFHDGLGVRIHIRTKRETWWSYIESAVIEIGDQTFELKGGNPKEGPNYWINGVPGKEDVASDENLKMLEKFLQVQMGVDFKFHYKNVSSKQHKFHISLNSQGDAVSFQTYKHWVSVNVKTNHKAGNFVTARGLMGAYPSGAMVGRNSALIIDDISFGKQWQVLAEEPMLFHEYSNVQASMECLMPDETNTLAKRRLGGSLLSEEDAFIACAHVKEEEQDACVFDVLATNDKETAGAY